MSSSLYVSRFTEEEMKVPTVYYTLSIGGGGLGGDGVDYTKSISLKYTKSFLHLGVGQGKTYQVHFTFYPPPKNIKPMDFTQTFIHPACFT